MDTQSPLQSQRKAEHEIEDRMLRATRIAKNIGNESAFFGQYFTDRFVIKIYDELKEAEKYRGPHS